MVPPPGRQSLHRAARRRLILPPENAPDGIQSHWSAAARSWTLCIPTGQRQRRQRFRGRGWDRNTTLAVCDHVAKASAFMSVPKAVNKTLFAQFVQRLIINLSSLSPKLPTFSQFSHSLCPDEPLLLPHHLHQSLICVALLRQGEHLQSCMLWWHITQIMTGLGHSCRTSIYTPELHNVSNRRSGSYWSTEAFSWNSTETTAAAVVLSKKLFKRCSMHCRQNKVQCG